MPRNDNKTWNKKTRQPNRRQSGVFWARINMIRQTLQPHGMVFPPAPSGKALGLLLKHGRQIKKTRRQKKRKTKNPTVITLEIPEADEARMSSNLQYIAHIANTLNIPIFHPKCLDIQKENISTLSLDKDGIEWCPNKNDEVIMIDDDDNPNDDNNTLSVDADKKIPTHVFCKDNKFTESSFKKPAVSPNCQQLPSDDFCKENKFTESSFKKPAVSPNGQQLPSDDFCKENKFTESCFRKPPVSPNGQQVPSDNFCKDNKFTESWFNKPVSQNHKQSNVFMSQEPGTSSAPDFIPIGSREPKLDKYGTDERLLSFRSGGDYKYSYEDIITGTFEDKLKECLYKGVAINSSTKQIENLNTELYKEYKAMVTNSEYQKLLKFREILPTYKKAQDILDVVSQNQVIVISGETGCGKSTQVPQIILDNAICNNKGANVKIMVTQPRRIAASCMASRVAEERAEAVGNSVGYAVRLEKIEARSRGSIMFCTTGILLTHLEVNQGLTGYSHVILDEVHERDCNIDLSMCMLKKVIKQRKDIKVILMSATIDAEKLSEYFDNCHMMHIEGLAYPVEDVYLEDILQMTKYKLPPPPPQRSYYNNETNNMQNSEMNRIRQYKEDIGPWLESLKYSLDSEVYKTLQDPRIEDMNIGLICKLLIYICCGPPGAVLVFLPGILDISKLIQAMTESQKFPDTCYEIHPLHSKLASVEQNKIFVRPCEGVRKIILSTNIAETSITIDDIVYVVDCGRMKITGLNIEENISTLQVEWVSRANFCQRRGRAGRCQPGVCYHVLTSHRASLLRERLLPEMQRSDLLEPVLASKRLRLGRAADALRAVPSPPAQATVQWAVQHLQQCGALDGEETLTPLGWHLARLPVHPAAGKLLLLGALFGCLDRAASVAAVWSFKDPFQLVIGKEKEVEQMKRQFALGEPSDHVALSEAVIQWERLPDQSREQFASEHFLSNQTLEQLADMKGQLGDSLKGMGFLASGDTRSAWENRNAFNLSLFKAVVAGSLYPKIATVGWKGQRNKQFGINVNLPGDPWPIAVHPSSVMYSPPPQRGSPQVPLCKNPGANWLVYWLKQRSSDLFLFEVTLVYTLPLLFFGELNVTVDNRNHSEDECYMGISTIKVRCKKRAASLLIKLRSLLDQVLASKVMVASDHSTGNSTFEQSVLNAVAELITAEDGQANSWGNVNQVKSEFSGQKSAAQWTSFK